MRASHRLQALKSVFTSPIYILVAIIGFAAYYELFNYMILVSNYGIFLVTAPIYLVYLLIGSAAVLLSLSIYTITKSIRTRYTGTEGSILSIITAGFGDLIIGCSCYAPILSSFMYAVGFGTIQVGAAISFLGNYQIGFLFIFIAANLIFIYYQLGRIVRIGGPAARR